MAKIKTVDFWENGECTARRCPYCSETQYDKVVRCKSGGLVGLCKHGKVTFRHCYCPGFTGYCLHQPEFNYFRGPLKEKLKDIEEEAVSLVRGQGPRGRTLLVDSWHGIHMWKEILSRLGYPWEEDPFFYWLAEENGVLAGDVVEMTEDIVREVEDFLNSSKNEVLKPHQFWFEWDEGFFFCWGPAGEEYEDWLEKLENEGL